MSDAALRTALTSDLAGPIDDEAVTLAESAAEAFGPATAAVLHYGSHVHLRGRPNDSAYDFFVIVDDNAAAFRSFTSSMQPRFGPGTATVLSRVLPPNIVGVAARRGSAAHRIAKCSVLSVRALERACSDSSQDHFTKGRLFQPVRLAWVRDAQSGERIADALVAARFGTHHWVRPYLPAVFDAATYCRTLLTTSFAGEIRPESSSRAQQLFEAQRAALVRLYEPLLAELARRGTLTTAGDGFREAVPPSRIERLRVATYFRRSKTRAAARWFKHVWLYDNWLDYLQQKVERHSGTAIELTPRERQWPLVFLWPKAIRFLLSRR